MPKISVVIPVYNVEKYLERCFNSVVEQSFTDYDIWIINDGSTDNSADICAAYKEKYPHKVNLIHQENRGVGAARNLGVNKCSGEYILFVDSDDYIELCALQKISDAIDAHNDPDMVIFDCRSFSDEKTLLLYKSNVEPRKVFSFFDHPEIIHTPINAWLRAVKRKIYINNNVTFPARLWYEDLATVPKLIVHCKTIVYIDEILYHYYIRNGSIMHNQNYDRKIELLSIMDMVLEFFKQKNLFNTFYPEIEFLAVSHILLGQARQLTRARSNHPVLIKMHEYLQSNFSNFYKNKYLKNLPLTQRFSLYLMYLNQFKLLHLMYKVYDSLKMKQNPAVRST